MKKELIKEEEDNLLDDPNKTDNEDNKDDDTPPADPPAPDEDEVVPPADPAPEEQSVIDLMVAGDVSAVKDAIHKHVVSVVATAVNDVGNEEEPAPEEDKKD